MEAIILVLQTIPEDGVSLTEQQEDELDKLEQRVWALSQAWWCPKTGPTLQRCYKMLRELNYNECLVFEEKTLVAATVRSLLEPHM